MPRKLRTAIVAVLGIAAAVVAALALKGPAIEAWYIHQLGSPDLARKKLAAERLGAVGSSRAVPHLLAAAEDEGCRKTAVASLVRIGPRALPALHRGLSAESRERQRVAATVLRELRPEGRVLIDLDVWLLENEGSEKDKPLQVLVRFSPLPADVMAKIGRHLRTENPPSWVFELIAAQGPAAAKAVPSLYALLIDALEAYRAPRGGGSIVATGPRPPPAPSLRAALLADREYPPFPDDWSGSPPALKPIVVGGPAAVPHLARALGRAESVEFRCRIYEALARIGPGAAAAHDAARAGLDDRDPDIRAWAIAALRFIGPLGDGVLTSVRGLLGDPDPGVKLAACAALIADGGAGPEAIGVVVDVLGRACSDDPETASGRSEDRAAHYLARDAAFALAERLTPPDGKVDAKIAGAIAAALGNRRTDVATYALRFVAKHGPHFASAARAVAETRRRGVNEHDLLPALMAIGAPAVPVLIDLLAGDDVTSRLLALKALHSNGRNASRALPAIIAIAGNEKSPEMRAEAMDAMGRIAAKRRTGGDAIRGEEVEAATGLLHRLADGDEEHREVRLAVLRALSRIAPDSPRTVAALAGALFRLGYAGGRSEILQALGDIGPAAIDAVPAIVEALPDAKDVYERIAALRALGQIGATDRAAIEALTAALGAENQGVRLHAAEALGAIGPAAAGCLPALVRALADRETMVRSAAAGAIRAIEPDHPAPWAALEADRASPDLRIRFAAVRTLGKIARGSERALRLVRPALEDREPDVRVAAAAALVDLGVDTDDALRVLIPVLDLDGRFPRQYAVDALGKLGPRAAEAVPRLEAALGDRDPGIRLAAWTALKAIRTAGASAAR